MPKMPKTKECVLCQGCGKVVYIKYYNSYIPEYEKEPISYKHWETGSYDKSVQCKKCLGRGWVGSNTSPTQCTSCSGKGKIEIKISTKQRLKEAPFYRVGIFPKKPKTCPQCKGTGKIVEMV
jgi:RecJ-like exonuclease